MPDRPAIPADITREILIEAGHRCAVCGAGCPLERAHIIPWHKSREHKAEDLICLCAVCHERADLEKWGEKTLREYKQKPWILRQYKSEEAVSTKSMLEITLAVELSDFDERSQRLFQYAIAAFLNVAPGNVRIVSVEESNSIKVILEVPSERAEILVEATRRDNAELIAFLHPFGLLSVDRASGIREARLNEAVSLKGAEPAGRLDTHPGSEFAQSGQKNEVIEESSKATIAEPPRTKRGIMLNPFAALAKQFVRSSPATLLGIGMTLSFVDSATLYAAASSDGVLYISQGIGLYNHYGLFSTVLGNAISLYLAKKYYEAVYSMRDSKAVVNKEVIEKPLMELMGMIELRGKYRYILYLLLIMGFLFWMSNFTVHVIGNPVARWGLVFDSVDHPLSFAASRLHNFYTWIIIMPFVGHVMICSSIQLRKAVEVASNKSVITYDLLNPDQRGGFVFIDKAHFAFNVIVALVFLQITMHIETFATRDAAYVLNYFLLIIMLIGILSPFVGNIYPTIKRLRFEALNKVKDNVYKDDKLSFEILKYCYERRTRTSLIVDFIIKAAPIVISIVINLWAAIAK